MLRGSPYAGQYARQGMQPMQPPQPSSQEVFHHNMQATVSGLNCTMGLLYGVVQLLEMGKIGAKFAFRALRAIARRIFRLHNITGPLRFLLRVITGWPQRGDAASPAQMHLMDKAWSSLGAASHCVGPSRSR